MTKVVFPHHERAVRKLCEESKVPYPLTKELVSVAFIRFTDDKCDTTLVVSDESAALLFFFQEKVPKDGRYNPSMASYVTITEGMRVELLRYMGEVAHHAADVRKARFPALAEHGLRAEIFWKEEVPRAEGA